MGAKLAHGHTLTRTDLPTDFVCHYQDRNVEIVPSLSYAVRHCVDIADLAQELVPLAVVFFIRHRVEDATSQALLTLVTTHLLHNTNGFGHVTTSV